MATPAGTGVPEWSVDAYRMVTAVAERAPEWVRHLVVAGTQIGVILLVVVLALAWWRLGDTRHQARALVLITPVATAVAYLATQLLKSGIQQDRPCQVITTIATCPPPDDWSFPSSHTTIACGLACGIVLGWRHYSRWRPVLPAVAVVLAGAVAFSGVFIGVHYPHDVVAGLLVAVLAFAVVTLVLRRPVTSLLAKRGAATAALDGSAAAEPVNPSSST